MKHRVVKSHKTDLDVRGHCGWGKALSYRQIMKVPKRLGQLTNYFKLS